MSLNDFRWFRRIRGGVWYRIRTGDELIPYAWTQQPANSTRILHTESYWHRLF